MKTIPFSPWTRCGAGVLALACLGGAATSAQAQALQAPSAQVQALIRKHYGGYAAGGQPAETFAQTTSATWANCSANGSLCQSRDELSVALSQGLHRLIPDLRWDILDMMASSDTVIVRGQGRGTPVGPFLGLPPTGKSFTVMSIDIHTLKDGRINHTHHLEDWAAAMAQLSAN